VGSDVYKRQGSGGQDGLAKQIAQRAPRRAIRETRLVLDGKLGDAAATLGDSANKATVVTNSAIIVFREGLEGVLILAAITASMVGLRRGGGGGGVRGPPPPHDVVEHRLDAAHDAGVHSVRHGLDGYPGGACGNRSRACGLHVRRIARRAGGYFAATVR
jgi:hypothetical protein